MVSSKFISRIIIFSLTLGIGVVVYAENVNKKVADFQLCNNEKCENFQNIKSLHEHVNDNVVLFSENAKENADKQKEDLILQYITLFITGVVPLFGVVWWIINNQQEKKIIEFSQIEDKKFQELMQTILIKQEESMKDVSLEIKELIKKLENINDNVQKNRIDDLKILYAQEKKFCEITMTIETLKETNDELFIKIKELENIVNKNFQNRNNNIG